MPERKPKAVFNWSGGKDSTMALYKTLAQGEYDIACLLTSVTRQYQRISMHGVRVELLRQQAASLGIPLLPMWMPDAPDMPAYENIVRETLTGLKTEGVTTGIFGDIFLEDLRQYREEKLAELGFKAIFPIWKIPTTDLVREFIDLGFKAVLSCVSDKVLDRSFAGRLIDDAFLRDLPEGVDPCGENGEFHSFVFDGPLFSHPIEFTLGEIVHREYSHHARDAAPDTPPDGFWYCDLVPVMEPAR
jgi:uncharacterized protein (TIGR00290 family)